VSTLLPIADGHALRAHARTLAGRHRAALVGVLMLHALAAAAGLAAPALLGSLVQSVGEGTTRAHIDTLVLVLAGFIALQTVLTWFARRASFVTSERIFAELREDFMRRVLALPLSTVERAGTGDLVSRTTADVDSLARTVRFAIPETLIAAITTALTVGAAIWISPPAALSLMAGVPALWVGTRWYLRRAPRGYLWERAAYAKLAGTVGETVDGGLTIESLGLNEHRMRQIDEELADAYRAERYTLRLRTYWFPTAEIAYVLPVVAGLVWGGWLVRHGHASIGEVTAVVLYAQQLADPVDRLVSWLDEIQVGAASLARLVGIEAVPPDRTPSDREPQGVELTARDVRYAYVHDRDVLHGIDLDLRPGERIAVVGPSGAGKSTLGRLLAGIHPPRTGKVEVGGVGLVELPLDTLRQEVALVTQEQHVFVGTLADNLRLARPQATEEELATALDAVDALEWAHALPHGLETAVGAGGEALTPPQTQQLALARLVLADPHTLVLDEATSLLDPRAARHLERSLGAVLEGRTVVAIAHRLHTAHDADRVAVVEDGLLREMGTHDELLDDGGAYAALWESWRS
jgi:ABC-type multidrug transport system fused ATPase/permease subunit